MASTSSISAVIVCLLLTTVSVSAQTLNDLQAKAADGDVHAQLRLAYVYATGEGIPMNFAESAKWYLKAAEQGDVFAERSIANMYHAGNGVKRDDAEAVRWYREAAEVGDSDAQAELGFMYSSGFGVAQDYPEAAKWYLAAAEQRQVGAQLNYGIMCADGLGVDQDYIEAYKWLSLAATFGNPQASMYLLRLNKVMTPDQITVAKRRASQWTPTAEASSPQTRERKP
jgi:uncharacterized protein